MWFSPHRRLPWLMVAGSALVLEVFALYFQYGLQLDPCVLCIYQRATVAGILITALLVSLAPRQRWLRVPGFIALLLLAAFGIKLALDLVAAESGATFGCSFEAEFPTWLALDDWFPAFFSPTGLCGDTGWRFLGGTMAEWMIVVFASYLVTVLIAVILELYSSITTRLTSR